MQKHIPYSFQFLSFPLLILIILNLFLNSQYHCKANQTQSVVDIGVVLDQNSPLGSVSALCMEMSMSDFYSSRPNHKTSLKFYMKDAKTMFDENLAVLELLQGQVHGIIGPQELMEEEFFSETGDKVHVPIISFTARSSSLTHTKISYFVRTAQDDAVQARALATICQGFQWPEVIILYEATEYGSQFLSHLSAAFQDAGIGLAYMIGFPQSYEDRDILKELNKINTNISTKVFIVHMNPSLGSKLFVVAKQAGMISQGFAWIITDNLSIFIDSMDSFIRDSMQGVLGIRPYAIFRKNLGRFQERWKRNMFLKTNTFPVGDPNVYCLWAYDTVTALATAIENIGPVNAKELFSNSINGTNLRISTLGPRLLNELKRTKFMGLSGNFQLVDGKLKPSEFEIFNVIGTGERRVGFWSPDSGIVQDLTKTTGQELFSTSTEELKSIIWPGDSVTKPKGWSIPPIGKLRVGIPWKPGFKEFVNASIDPITKQVSANGFSIDIFLTALTMLPFPIDYEYHLYNDSNNINWSYDDMLQKIPQDYDMVVADATIWAPRASYVDFSLPYLPSGVVLVVKNEKPRDMFIFVKPFKWDLWIAIILACMGMGFFLYLLERQVVSTGEGQSRQTTERSNRALLPITYVAALPGNLVSNKLSMIVLLCWGVMIYILMQSFSANLSAILTIDQINFAFSDQYYIGYHAGSFMKQFLIQKLHIDPSKLKGYSSVEEFHDAMLKGSKNGGIDVIFDEVPYTKLFMEKYDSQYKIVGPTYTTGGLGFAFPIESPLVSYFSRAILNVTQGSQMISIEQKNFGPGYSSQDPLSSTISQGTSGLTFYQFSGLFIIVGSFTIFSVIYSELQRIFCPRTEPDHPTGANPSSSHTGEGQGHSSDVNYSPPSDADRNGTPSSHIQEGRDNFQTNDNASPPSDADRNGTSSDHIQEGRHNFQTNDNASPLSDADRNGTSSGHIQEGRDNFQTNGNASPPRGPQINQQLV